MNEQKASPRKWSCVRATGALICALLIAASAGACDRPDASRTITITGSSTIAPVMSELAVRFEAAHPGTRVDVQTGGSSRGVADARSGVAELGMVSRALAGEESDLTAVTLAYDSVGVIVHADNPVAGLTHTQLVDIYAGRISRWSEVGGPDLSIATVHKAEGRSTHELFLAYTHLEADEVRAAVVIGDNQQGIKTVAGSREAIGSVSIGAAETEQRLGAQIRLIAIDGALSSHADIAAGTAPMTRPLNLVYAGEPEPLVRELLAFVTSQDARPLLEHHGFVPRR